MLPSRRLLGRLLETEPLLPTSLVSLVARAAVVVVFARSASAHLADWNTTLYLFENEYRLPWLPSEWAACLGVGLEVAGSALLILGLFTRLAALALTGMVGVIQCLVYPAAWPEHLQWAAPLLVLLSQGGGRASLDALLARRLQAGSPRPRLPPASIGEDHAPGIPPR